MTKAGVNILTIGQKFTTYGTLNFFVSGPILKSFSSAESLDQKGHVTKYSPLQTTSSGFCQVKTFKKVSYCHNSTNKLFSTTKLTDAVWLTFLPIYEVVTLAGTTSQF